MHKLLGQDGYIGLPLESARHLHLWHIKIQVDSVIDKTWLCGMQGSFISKCENYIQKLKLKRALAQSGHKLALEPSALPSHQLVHDDIGTKFEAQQILAPDPSCFFITKASLYPTIRHVSITWDELVSMNMNVNRECVNLSRFYLDHEEDYINRVSPDYPQRVQGLSDEDIRLIFNNLLRCANALKMCETAIYLAIDIVHRILTQINIGTTSPYLLATALFVAQKVEPSQWGILPGSRLLSKLFGENNTHFTSTDLYGNEIVLLHYLNFHVETITPYHYVKFFSNAAGFTMQQKSLLHYLTQMCAMTPESYRYKPSALTAAGVLLVNEAFGLPCWTERLSFFTTYSPEMLASERAFLLSTWIHVTKLAQGSHPPAVFVKFSSHHFGNVSSLLSPTV